MKALITSLVALAILLAGAPVSGQDNEQDPASEFSKELRPFDRIVSSPKINIVLTEGEQESVRVVYSRITRDKINVDVNRKTLRIYLDNARVTEKPERVSPHEKRNMYADANVTAYVTYRNLRQLEIRGEQGLTCNSPISAEKFKLKAYGRNEINLVSVKTGYFKTNLYGENRLRINGGKADYQRYKLYGENKINTEDLKSYETSATIFGENKVRISSQDEIKITCFGEASIAYAGDADVNRGIIIGKAAIRRLD